MTSLVLDGLLSLALGTWVTLLGFGVATLSKDAAKAEEFRRRWGAFFKFAGPLIILWGVYNTVRAL